MTRKITKVGIVGAGTMGGGIAQVFALHGFSVTLVDKGDEILKDALKRIKEHTAPELWEKVSSFIYTSTDISGVKDCTLIIEAVFEDVGIKKALFKDLSRVCKKDAVIATNTSSIPISKLASAVKNPSRFIRMHFMNPPKVMKLVEIVRGEKTSQETVALVKGLAEELDKVTAVAKDFPGFVSNRLLFALIGEAIRLLEKGIASKEDIDIVMKYGMSHPVGPLELADFIGLDICKNIVEIIFEASGDEGYKPPHLLEGLVREGKLGRKSGEGFYKYT